MAECVVSFLLSKLSSFLEEEGKFLGGRVRKEVVFVKNELERMKAFLQVAEKEEQSIPEIQVWVNQVRDMAYDTEDVLDEFMLHLVHRYSHGFVASLRKISRYVNNLKARHWIASEIEDIKARIGEIDKGHQRYRHSSNVGEQGSSSNNARTETWYDLREDALLLDEAQLVGINKHREELIRRLNIGGDSRLKVVSIVGMGGLGKTTLVGKVYDDVKVKTGFESHAQITLSQSFEPEERLKEMIRQLYGEINEAVPKDVESMNIEGLKSSIKEFLRYRRYFIVLDDVWCINHWDAFKAALPDSNCGSRVMLTTRIGDVASTSSKECHGSVYKLMPLSQEDSWTLFCRRAFEDGCCPCHLVKLSMSMLKRCQGLPLAIVVISGVLATKNPDKISEWEMVYRSLGVELEDNERFKSMEKILLLSYYHLPFHLKSCFLYLSIFPEDHLIEPMTLIRLWTAEGFVKEKQGMIAEEVAETYLKQLISRSLIQVAERTSYGRVKNCRIHDLVQEIILSKSKDQNLVTIVSRDQEIRLPKEVERVRRLSVHNSWENVQENNNQLSRLRSFLMFGKVDSQLNSPPLSLFSDSLRLLKVLDLRGALLGAFPNEITKLFYLRYLSLRDTKVEMLPSSIGKLQNLQTLDLKNTKVTVLPVEITQLPRLCHLLVYSYNQEVYEPFHRICGFRAPSRIGELRSLQKLCHMEANEGSVISIENMGNLVHLRRLGIIKLRREDGSALCSSIKKMSNLRSLSVTSVEEDEIIDLQHLSSPPQSLQRVYLKGRLEKLPHWISSLHVLVRLKLQCSQLMDDPLESLGALPILVELELEKAYNGETLCFKAGGFQRLKILYLTGLDRLRMIKAEKGSMPNLEKLDIEACELLESMPLGIQCLTNLNELYLADMSHEFIMALKLDGGDEDYWRKEHITQVFIVTTKDRTSSTHSLKRE